MSIGSCGTCHDSSRSEGLEEFDQVHGGLNPEYTNVCHVCHNAISSAAT